jgi:HTH-type transcriptional regulator/antitoxin HigA
MKIKPIRTRAGYRASLKAIESLMNARPKTPEGERLDALVTLVESYEREQFPLGSPAASFAERHGA